MESMFWTTSRFLRDMRTAICRAVCRAGYWTDSYREWRPSLRLRPQHMAWLWALDEPQRPEGDLGLRHPPPLEKRKREKQKKAVLVVDSR